LYSILSAELRRRMRVEQALQQDITERKGLQAVQEQHVRAMEDLRQFLQATLDAFPANTVVLDVDGTIISFNAAWAHFAGRNGARTATHFLETNYLTVCDTAVGPGSAEAAAAAAGIRGVIAGFHDHFVLEYPCDSPDKQRWFAMRVTPLEKPAPRRVVIAHLDLTERWLAQEELQKALGTSEQRIIERTSELQAAKERVEAIVNNSADGILLVNFDLCIHQTNLSFSRLFGCAPGDFSGASFETLTHPDDADLVVETVGAAVAERNRKTTEVRARRRDGSLFDAELSVGFVSGEGLVCNVRDITERKRSEEALRQALVAETELSELKSRFVSMASHEFRTPLATILTNADILAAYRDKMSEDQVTEKLKTIQEQVALLRDIMEDLLHMARMEARRVEFKPVFLDPDALCREVIEEFQSGRGATHRLVYSCGPVPQSVS
ncbi:MAG: PAS domain S-box protein, partial [Solirubrobacterales bacterium]|nr:PAS domain S-box protein [Solirubrobacterales bacterium]